MNRLLLERGNREKRRRQMRRKLLEFVKHWVPGYVAGDFHIYLCERLERFMAEVEAGLCPRLMLFVPPAHGKTEIATRAFPTWMMGHHPEWRILAATYNQNLANEFGMEVRRRVCDPEFARLFPTAANALYRTTQNQITTMLGGTYNALGIGGAGGGRHAHVAIIDDPVKTRLDAESPTYQERNFNWYSGTLRNRLLRGAGVLIIQTRWHVADLSGRILDWAADDLEADQFEVIEFPAIATGDDILGRSAGDPLCPELYNLKELNAIRHSSLERDWASLFQQQPYLEGGNLIKLEHFEDAMPERITGIWQAWDLATTDKSREYGDRSACATIGRDIHGQFHILEIYRCKEETPVVADEIIRLHRKWQPQTIWLEANGPGTPISQVLEERRRALGIKIPYELVSVQRDGDKVERSLPFRDCVGLGMVSADQSADWWQAFADEARQFPDQQGSPNQIDACSLAYLKLQAMHGGKEIRREERLNPHGPGGKVQYSGRDALRARLLGRSRWANTWGDA